jgi:hypothetical protein
VSASALEVEVARWALLEPQTVVVRCVLEKLRCFLEYVLLGGRVLESGRVAVLLGERVLNTPLAGLTGGVSPSMIHGRRYLGSIRRSW